MVRFTGTLTAVPPLGVMRMLPVYGPACNTFELTLTVKEYEVVGLEMAVVESQLEPAVTCTVKGTPAAPEALFTVIDWPAGLDPDSEVKVSEVTDTVTVSYTHLRAHE